MVQTDRDEGTRRRFEISLTQLIAGAGAAACGAWAASKIGVAGTVLGAALVSMLVTILSAVYAHAARRAQDRLVTARDLVRQRAGTRSAAAAAASGAPSAQQAGGAHVDEEAGAPTGAGPGEQVAGGQVAAAPTADEPPARGLMRILPRLGLEDENGYRWKRIFTVGLTVFVLAMAVVTVVELALGHPLSCSTASVDCGRRTTLVPALHNSSPATPSHAPSPSPSVSTPVTTSPTPSTASTSPGTSGSSTPSPSGSVGSPTPTGSADTSPSGTPSP